MITFNYRRQSRLARKKREDFEVCGTNLQVSTHAASGPVAIPVEVVERRIYLIRGHKVMVDSDLADLYQVATGNLNLAVRRNADRFPEDFMFQLTEGEFEILSLQTAISRWGGRRYLPFAFTEHGVAMLSAVLKSKRAVQMSILVVRAFVRLREMLASNKDLAARMEKLEAVQKDHASVINILAEEIDTLRMPVTLPAARRIGFKAG
jgi:hypothetical protein